MRRSRRPVTVCIPNGSEQTDCSIVRLGDLEARHVANTKNAAWISTLGNPNELGFQIEAVDFEAGITQNLRMFPRAAAYVQNTSHGALRRVQDVEQAGRVGRVVLDLGVEEIVELSGLRVAPHLSITLD